MYITGTASSFADLLSALQDACTGNGYTLDGSVLYKDTLFADVSVISQTFPCLRVKGGTGHSSGALTGASDIQSAQLGVVAASGDSNIPLVNVPFAFPMQYEVHIHTDPDEVYFVVNYSDSFYQFIAFGQSAAAGLAGTGNWYAGTDIESNRSCNAVDVRGYGGYMQGTFINGGLFMAFRSLASTSANGALDHELDSATWLCEGAWRDWWNIFSNSPSSWNGESILMPVRIYAPRPSGFVSIVAELAHARFIAIDNVDDQQIITLGSDKWKVYPWWARGTRGNVDGNGITYTGKCGHAIRYDGP